MRRYLESTTFLRTRSILTKTLRSRAFSSSSECMSWLCSSPLLSTRSESSARRPFLLRGRRSVPMTNTPIQIAERAPSRLIQNELSREANLSPKFEAHVARQGRRYSAGKSRRDRALKESCSFPFKQPSRCWFAMPPAACCSSDVEHPSSRSGSLLIAANNRA